MTAMSCVSPAANGHSFQLNVSATISYTTITEPHDPIQVFPYAVRLSPGRKPLAIPSSQGFTCSKAAETDDVKVGFFGLEEIIESNALIFPFDDSGLRGDGGRRRNSRCGCGIIA